jgi:hypothetical protein
MTVGTVISAAVSPYTNKKGIETTDVVYDVIDSERNITVFRTFGKEIIHEVGDGVFLIEQNGYMKGYSTDAITKENVVKTKEFSNSWDDMWK